MIHRLIILAIVVATVTAIALLPLFKKQTDSLFRVLLFNGVVLVADSFSSVSDYILNGIVSLFRFAPFETPTTDYVQLAAGFGLIAIAFVHRHSLFDKLNVLNMQGKVRHYLANDTHLNNLNVPDYQIREYVIDSIWAQDNLGSLNKSQWRSLLSQIEQTVKVFCNRDFKKSFTGMAPIPLTIYAGTCYEGEAVNSYLEYNNSTHEYSALSNSKRFPDLTCENYDYDGQDEIVVAIETTSKITEAETIQFKMPVVHMSVPDPHDNMITSGKQLKKYVDTISEKIESLSKGGVKRIHLLCATQSCLAFALGQKLAHKTNRVPEIISYHFVKASTPCYQFGLIVIGDKKGNVEYCNA